MGQQMKSENKTMCKKIVINNVILINISDKKIQIDRH